MYKIALDESSVWDVTVGTSEAKGGGSKVAQGVRADGTEPGDPTLISRMRTLDGDGCSFRLSNDPTCMRCPGTHAYTLNTKAKGSPLLLSKLWMQNQELKIFCHDPMSHFISFENVWHTEASGPTDKTDLNPMTLGQGIYHDITSYVSEWSLEAQNFIKNKFKSVQGMERGMFKKQNKTNCHRFPYNLYSRDLVSYKKKKRMVWNPFRRHYVCRL